MTTPHDACVAALIAAAEALDTALYGGPDAGVAQPLAGDALAEGEAARITARRALARVGVVDCDDCGTPTPLKALHPVRRGGRAGVPTRVERQCARCTDWRRSTLGQQIADYFRDVFKKGKEG